jgi:hypothetical protein
MVEEFVREALRRRSNDLGLRSGKSAAVNDDGLEIGPQRYHDPSIWGPDYALRDAPPAAVNSAARVAAMQRVPPAAEQRFPNIVRALTVLDTQLAAGDDLAQGGLISWSAQTIVLIEMLLRPSQYIQRCVEHVDFCAHGGQSWKRTMQLRIPSAGPPGLRTWLIAPVGQYARRRLPDLEVTDWDNRRLTLLTWDQHGEVLARAMLCRCLDSLPRQGYPSLFREQSVLRAYSTLRSQIVDFFKATGDLAEPERTLTNLAKTYQSLLTNLWVSPKAAESRIADLVKGLTALLDSTPQLCWVRAGAGDVLNLQITYTTRDPRHAPTYSGPPYAAVSKPRRGSRLTDRLSDFGLAPIKHEFNMPSRLHAGSYYFTIMPPDKTSTMYLDWEVGSSLDHDETISCSLDSAYLPEDDHSELSTARMGNRVRVFLRVSPHQRAQILAAAVLNIILVWLFRDGHAPGGLGDPLKGFIIAAPTGLIAYLVGQQRHYYAYPLRRQRAVLWGYLTVSILFLLTVSLSQLDAHQDGVDLMLTVVAWTLLASSAGVLAWYLPLGFGFNWTVAHIAKQRCRRDKVRDRKWEVYVSVYQAYGKVVVLGVLVAMIGTIAALARLWPQAPADQEPPPQTRSVLVGDRGSGQVDTTARIARRPGS